MADILFYELDSQNMTQYDDKSVQVDEEGDDNEDDEEDSEPKENTTLSIITMIIIGVIGIVALLSMVLNVLGFSGYFESNWEGASVKTVTVTDPTSNNNQQAVVSSVNYSGITNQYLIANVIPSSIKNSVYAMITLGGNFKWEGTIGKRVLRIVNKSPVIVYVTGFIDNFNKSGTGKIALKFGEYTEFLQNKTGPPSFIGVCYEDQLS